MTFIDLISHESGPRTRALIITASLAGVANVLILYLVNHTAAAADGAQLADLLGIVLALALYVLCARRTNRTTHDLIESALQKTKIRIVDRINRTELKQLEQTGTSVIYDRLSENITTISDSAGFISNLLQSLCIVVFATLYIAALSPIGFALLLVINVTGIALFAGNNVMITDKLARVAAARVGFLERLTDLLHGAKEIRFARRREAEVADDLRVSSHALKSATIDVNAQFDDNYILAQCFQYMSLLAIVFVLPLYTTTDPGTVTALLSGFLFLWGPLGGSVGGVPALMRANNALANLESLEMTLSAAQDEAPDDAPPPAEPFTSLAAEDLCYEYPNTSEGNQFRIGPVNLKIVAGEVLFIVGGNGSGKSTFLKVLTGLYPATSGRLVLNDAPLHPSDRASLRELFSTIFGDFHLFTKLYGLHPDEAEVGRLLEQMQIQGKTAFAGRGFTRRDLSTGQRKRLAMVVTLLEDRPICVLDEWAADQDPEFRKYFYEQLIPSFKQRGVTVIAVTHDDRYFHCADRVVTMEYGQIRSILTTREDA